MANLPLVSPEFSKVAIVLFSKHLEIKDMAELSRVNKQIRIFVLEILFNRLKLDRPHDLPKDQLGKFLNATVINLGLFIRNPLRKAAGESHFPALSRIPGFQPDPSNIILDVNKMTSIHIVALGSLELFNFCLERQARDEKGLLDLYQVACRLKRLDMAHRILERIILPESTFLKKSFDLIYTLYYQNSSRPQEFAISFDLIYKRLNEEVHAILRESKKELPHCEDDLVKSPDLLEADAHDYSAHLEASKAHIARGNARIAHLKAELADQKQQKSALKMFFSLFSNFEKVLTKTIPLPAESHYSFFLELLCCTYRAGDLRANVHLNLTQLVEDKIVRRILQALYEQSHVQLFHAACDSGSAEMIKHFFQRLEALCCFDTTTSNFESVHLSIAHRLGCSRQMLDIMLREKSYADVLRGAYFTKDTAFIDSCRQQLDLNSVPDPRELSYACETNNPAMVTHALTRIDRINCNKDAASKITCISGNLAILELLIQQDLFFLSPIINHSNFILSLETAYFSKSDFLSSLFQNAKERGQLEQLLDLVKMTPDIISSDAYAKAVESLEVESFFDQNKAHIHSEQHLLRAIRAGDLATVKALMPKDVIPSAIAQKVLACAAWGSPQALDILLHFMQNGLKLTHLSNEALSDLFFNASRQGHLEAAKALVRQAFEKGYQCKQLLQDQQGRYLEVALLKGNTEMTRFIRTVAVHGDLNFDKFMKKFETKQPVKQSRWEKFKAICAQVGQGFYESFVIFWNILKSPFRLFFG